MPSIISGSAPGGRGTPDRTVTLTTKPMPSSRVAPIPANQGSLPNLAKRSFFTCRAVVRLLMRLPLLCDRTEVLLDLLAARRQKLTVKVGVLGQDPVLVLERRLAGW